MRLAFTLFAMLALTLTSAAQKPDKYDENHKHQLFSNTGVVVDAGLSYNINDGTKNTNLLIRFDKRLSKYWYVIGGGEISGFLANGFDRHGKLMAGLSFDALPFEAYIMYGANFNPGENKNEKFGIAMKGGINMQFKITDVFSIRIGGGIDRINNGSKWQSNATATVGCKFDFGVTEQDRIAISINNTMRETYGEIKQENQLLKANEQRITQANEQLQATLDRATAALELATERLNNCQTEKKQIAENCGNDPLSQPILFEYASSSLRPDAYETVEDIAEVIKADMSDAMYSINGYCSNNGDPYRNQKLSEERAYTVFMALKLLGVDSSRLFVVGNGMTDKDSARDQKVIVRKAL